MMRLILALMTTFATYDDAFAKESNAKCADMASLQFQIVQKISDHEYEIKSDFGKRGILKTKEAIYDTTGYVVGIGAIIIGTVPVKLSNGFSATYPIFQECSYDKKLDCAYKGSNPTLALPRPRKGTNCSKSSKNSSEEVQAVAQTAVKKQNPKNAKELKTCNNSCSNISDFREATTCYNKCTEEFD